MDLASELTNFIKRLRDTSEVCARPRENGHKCPQCYERLSIAKDLEWMLRQYFESKQQADRTYAEVMEAIKASNNA